MNSKNKELAGLIGQGIQGSLFPMIHEAEAKENGLELIYRIIDFAAPKRDASFLQNMLLAVESLNFKGLNITHPYKEDAFKLVDELSEDAQKIGSINTIIFKDGKRFGDNTDWYGFSENFKAGIPNAEIDIVAQIGTGGAGLAVAYAMLKMGTTEIHLFDTQKDKANALAKNLQTMFPDRKIIVVDNVENALQNAKGIINATPIGMEGIPGTPVDRKYLHKDLWIADIVYFPIETQFLKEAKAAGCRTVGGGGMVVRQAAGSFRQFFDIEPNIERMLQQFNNYQNNLPK